MSINLYVPVSSIEKDAELPGEISVIEILLSLLKSQGLLSFWFECVEESLGSNSQIKKSSYLILPSLLALDVPLTKLWETTSLFTIITKSPGFVETIVLSKFTVLLSRYAFSKMVNVKSSSLETLSVEKTSA